MFVFLKRKENNKKRNKEKTHKENENESSAVARKRQVRSKKVICMYITLHKYQKICTKSQFLKRQKIKKDV